MPVPGSDLVLGDFDLICGETWESEFSTSPARAADVSGLHSLGKQSWDW